MDGRYICNICKARYSDENYLKKTEDWIMCIVCEDWFIETCCQENGLIEDWEALICTGCIDVSEQDPDTDRIYGSPYWTVFNLNFHFHILVWLFYDHIKIKMEKLFDI